MFQKATENYNILSKITHCIIYSMYYTLYRRYYMSYFIYIFNRVKTLVMTIIPSNIIDNKTVVAGIRNVQKKRNYFI